MCEFILFALIGAICNSSIIKSITLPMTEVIRFTIILGADSTCSIEHCVTLTYVTILVLLSCFQCPYCLVLRARVISILPLIVRGEILDAMFRDSRNDILI